MLCVSWELWLAPLRPGGSLIALKALPLALPLGGILSGSRYTYQWSSMLILAYFAEGATRAWAERGTSQTLALAEIVLSLVFFGPQSLWGLLGLIPLVTGAVGFCPIYRLFKFSTAKNK